MRNQRIDTPYFQFLIYIFLHTCSDLVCQVSRFVFIFLSSTLCLSIVSVLSETIRGVVGCVVVCAFGAEGRWFDSTFGRHVRTLDKSFTRNCLYDVMWRPVWLPCG